MYLGETNNEVDEEVFDALALDLGQDLPAELDGLLQHLQRVVFGLDDVACLQHPVNSRPRVRVVLELGKDGLRMRELLEERKEGFRNSRNFGVRVRRLPGGGEPGDGKT